MQRAVRREPWAEMLGTGSSRCVASKLHDDMKKSQQDDTLEHSLFAAANTE